MNRFAIAFVLAASVAACKSKKPDTTPPPTGSGAAPANAKVAPDPNVKMELGEIRIIDVNNGGKAVVVKADGMIEYEGQVGAKLTANGQIVNDKGEVGFTLMSDGSIKGPDGATLPITLSADAVIKSGDKSISINDDGSLNGANPEGGVMKIEGATTLGLKRTALFVLIVLTTPEEAPPPPAPTTK